MLLLVRDVSQVSRSPDIEHGMHNKEKFRAIAEKLNLPIPETQNHNSKSLDYPVIIKPVDSFSGRGITVIKNHNKKLFDSAIELARKNSATEEYLLEKFVSGELYSHSAFLKNKGQLKIFLSKKTQLLTVLSLIQAE